MVVNHLCDQDLANKGAVDSAIVETRYRVVSRNEDKAKLTPEVKSERSVAIARQLMTLAGDTVHRCECWGSSQ
jgi:hypothetical protein